MSSGSNISKGSSNRSSADNGKWSSNNNSIDSNPEGSNRSNSDNHHQSSSNRRVDSNPGRSNLESTSLIVACSMACREPHRSMTLVDAEGPGRMESTAPVPSHPPAPLAATIASPRTVVLCAGGGGTHVGAK